MVRDNQTAENKFANSRWANRVFYRENIGAVEKVKEATLLEDYHKRGFIQKDVAWCRNVGLYKMALDQEGAVVYDMEDVRRLRDHEKTNC